MGRILAGLEAARPESADATVTLYEMVRAYLAGTPTALGEGLTKSASPGSRGPSNSRRPYGGSGAMRVSQ